MLLTSDDFINFSDGVLLGQWQDLLLGFTGEVLGSNSGSKQLKVVLADQAGNQTTEVVANIFYDNESPSLVENVALLSSTAADITNNQDLEFSWDQSTDNHLLDKYQLECSQDNFANIIFKETDLNNAIITLGEGTGWQCRVRVADVAGNNSANSYYLQDIIVDITLPEINNIEVVNISGSGAVLEFTVFDEHWPLSNIDQIGEVNIVDENELEIQNLSITGEDVVNGLISLEILNLSPGTIYYYGIKVYDRAGNEQLQDGFSFVTEGDSGNNSGSSGGSSSGSNEEDLTSPEINNVRMGYVGETEALLEFEVFDESWPLDKTDPIGDVYIRDEFNLEEQYLFITGEEVVDGLVSLEILELYAGTRYYYEILVYDRLDNEQITEGSFMTGGDFVGEDPNYNSGGSSGGGGGSSSSSSSNDTDEEGTDDEENEDLEEIDDFTFELLSDDESENGLMTGATITGAVITKDIAEHWSKDFVVKLQEKGAVTPGKSFYPEKMITRVDFLKIVLTSFEVEVPELTEEEKKQFVTIFKDINKDNLAEEWWAKYVYYAYNQKIINGYADGNFYVNGFVSRSQALKIIAKVAGLKILQAQIAPFNDVGLGYWDTDYIHTFKVYGLIEGFKGNLFKPKDWVSRGQAAKLTVITMNNE